MIDAGKYKYKISICNATITEDASGFQVVTPAMPPVFEPYANVHTTRGMTIIKNDSSFEKALTNFTIRYRSGITRDMLILFRNKVYQIEYLNNVNEANVELEIQAKEITH